MEWEEVIFKEPCLSISGNCIYFNSAMRDMVVKSNGMDFFKAEDKGKIILSCKPGNQFLFSRKKNERRIVCHELIEYIKDVYGGVRRFKLVLKDGYYILVPK